MNIVSLFNARFKAQDQFELIIRPYVDPLYRLAFRLSGSQHEAEELVQAYLVRLYPKLDQLKTIDKLSPWLKRGLYRLYIDSYRKQKRELNLFDSEADVGEMVNHQNGPKNHSEQMETLNMIKSALNQLNSDQRIIVLMHDSEGYTLEEASQILEVPVGTLKSRLHRARNQLREIMELEPSDYLTRVESMS